MSKMAYVKRMSLFALLLFLVFAFAANNNPAAQTEDPGTIDVRALTLGVNSALPFTSTVPGYETFTLESNEDNPGSIYMEQIAPGEYTIIQNPVAGTVLHSIECESEVEPVIDPASRSVTINLQPAENLSCIFRILSDDAEPSRITVIKEVTSGDESQGFAFELTGAWQNHEFTVSESGGAVVLENLYGMSACLRKKWKVGR